MKITVREHRNSDYEVCRSLWGELTLHHASIYEDPSIAGDDPGRGFDEYLARTDLCCAWIVESGGKILGFAGLLDTVGEEGVAEIEPVVISSTSRGAGIGTKLIQHAINEAKIRGFQFLSVRPELRNEKAFALYVSLGFDHVGSVELFQELLPESHRSWKSGIIIHGKKLKY